MLFNVWNVSLPQLQCRCSCQYFCSIPECVCIATTAMSTLMPIFLLYLGGCIGGSCVYTCTVHWTVQLSRDQTELASVNSLYSVHFKKCPQTERSTGGLFNRDETLHIFFWRRHWWWLYSPFCPSLHLSRSGAGMCQVFV